MVERLLILITLAASIGVVWALLRRRQRRRLGALADQRPFATILPDAGPAVVAFSLPNCAECRARQAPALERLRGLVGGAVVITTLAADRYGDLLDRLGIMTVPATAVLDAKGIVRVVNQGFADEVRLLQQLVQVGRSPPRVAHLTPLPPAPPATEACGGGGKGVQGPRARSTRGGGGEVGGGNQARTSAGQD